MAATIVHSSEIYLLQSDVSLSVLFVMRIGQQDDDARAIWVIVLIPTASRKRYGTLTCLMKGVLDYAQAHDGCRISGLVHLEFHR
jgi:hypothetical protein